MSVSKSASVQINLASGNSSTVYCLLNIAVMYRIIFIIIYCTDWVQRGMITNVSDVIHYLHVAEKSSCSGHDHTHTVEWMSLLIDRSSYYVYILINILCSLHVCAADSVGCSVSGVWNYHDWARWGHVCLACNESGHLQPVTVALFANDVINRSNSDKH